ncbi:hypothetical protein C8R44DRAFT_869112 [Mycena epipterygia]|nr:hypothetical protein C8R44DRAFT_869112 [Mycena epipterygia]
MYSPHASMLPPEFVISSSATFAEILLLSERLDQLVFVAAVEVGGFAPLHLRMMPYSSSTASDLQVSPGLSSTSPGIALTIFWASSSSRQSQPSCPIRQLEGSSILAGISLIGICNEIGRFTVQIRAPRGGGDCLLFSLYSATNRPNHISGNDKYHNDFLSRDDHWIPMQDQRLSYFQSVKNGILFGGNILACPISIGMGANWRKFSWNNFQGRFVINIPIQFRQLAEEADRRAPSISRARAIIKQAPSPHSAHRISETSIRIAASSD